MSNKLLVIALSSAAAFVVLTLTTTITATPKANATTTFIDGSTKYTTNGTTTTPLATFSSPPLTFDQRGDHLLIGEYIAGSVTTSDSTSQFTLLIQTSNKNPERIIDTPVAEAKFAANTTSFFIVDAQTRHLSYIPSTTKTPTQLTDFPVVGISISPDNQNIVYQKLSPDWKPGMYFDNGQGLFLYNLKTKSEIQLTNTWEDFGAFWSPSSDRIFYYSPNNNAYTSLWSIALNGTIRTQITNTNDNTPPTPTPSEKPTWAPNGNTFVYESDGEILTHHFPSNKITNLGKGTHPTWLTNNNIRVITKNSQNQFEAKTISIP
jgi:hypothetical protein